MLGWARGQGKEREEGAIGMGRAGRKRVGDERIAATMGGGGMSIFHIK